MATSFPNMKGAWPSTSMYEQHKCCHLRTHLARTQLPRPFQPRHEELQASRQTCRYRRKKSVVEAELLEQKQKEEEDSKENAMQAEPIEQEEAEETHNSDNGTPSESSRRNGTRSKRVVAEDDSVDDLEEDPYIGEDSLDTYDRFFQHPGDPTQREIPEGEPAYFTQEEYDQLCDLPMPDEVTQQTLQHSIHLEGPGMHSGKISTVRIMPAFAGEGRYFVLVPEGSIQDPEMPASLQEQLKPKTEEERQPQPKRPFWGDETVEEVKLQQDPDEVVGRSDDDIVIEAVLDNARLFPEDCLFVTLEQQGHKIYAAETLLASLEACGVDNCRIEVEMRQESRKKSKKRPTGDQQEADQGEEDIEPQVDLEGYEMPLTDGSAMFWADNIKQVTVRPAPAIGEEGPPQKEFLQPEKIISVREGDSFITLMPSSSQRVTVGIDHTDEAPVIANQWVSWSPTNTAQHHYRWLMAPARMYLPSAQEGFRRRAQGYFKGALDPTVMAIADWTTWHELMLIRYTDEAVRWRMTEFLADLSLLSSEGRGGIPRGHITAYQASRGLTLRFLKAVRKVCAAHK